MRDGRMRPCGIQQILSGVFCEQVTTPLLILHGEADQRLPTLQGTEYFQLLVARGKTVRM